MKAEWVDPKERLPESGVLNDIDNKYYVIITRFAGYSQAMFIDGEWYTSYQSKLITPVKYWLDSER